MRFDDQPKRIARRAERDRFAFLMVPVIWFLLLAGLPLVVGVSLAIIRVLRGHFSGALDEP